MLGAIIGDIIGSIYEHHNINTKDFELFSLNCRFTDDTVMTVAVAEGIMEAYEQVKKDEQGWLFQSKELFQSCIAESMKKWGRLYPRAGYGGNFSWWLMKEGIEPYGSYGNGSAMRVSPCAWICSWKDDSCDDTDHVDFLACCSASVTHNHVEGLKGAIETAEAIWRMRRANQDNDEIQKMKEIIRNRSKYDLDFSLDEIRPHYRFDVSCQNSVPQAIVAFLESMDFEDAVRNAVSIGGDSDTIAAIAGSIAEAA